MSEARSWSGADYDRLSTPMEAMGREVLERLPLTGGETVIDAGCGSGRVTEALLARLPAGRVIGVDQSASMIDAARERLGDGAELHVADLSTFDLGLEADAILSTATFHWIADHDALFARLRAHLRPAECWWPSAAAKATSPASMPPPARRWRASPMRRASRAGAARGTSPRPARPRSACALPASSRPARGCRSAVTPDEPHAYLTEINLGAHLERLPEPLRPRFVDEVIDRVGGPPVTIDYVRLNIDAVA